MTPDTPESRRPRGVYLLPNLFTTAALFCGFYAIIAALNSRFEPAAIAVFIAMVLDGLDDLRADTPITTVPVTIDAEGVVREVTGGEVTGGDDKPEAGKG